jgi:hypothetical protein
MINCSNIFPIHPSFRLIGLAEPPNLQDSSQHWLTPELLTLFVYHDLRPLPADEETSIITDLVPGVSKSMERGLVEFVETLRRSQDTNVRSLHESNIVVPTARISASRPRRLIVDSTTVANNASTDGLPKRIIAHMYPQGLFEQV